MDNHVKFFTLDQNVAKTVKYNLTKFELSMSSRFQDITVQNLQFSPYFNVAILSVLWRKINFWKLAYVYLKSS